MKAMSFRVGMTWWGAARWLTATALCCLGLVDVGPQAQEVPLVWDAEWTVIQPEDSASRMEAKAWEAMLESAMVLQPPQRILGIPFQHVGSRITGRWKKAFDAGMSVPRGAASAWDRTAMEQSRLLFESRMLRAGYLDGRARFDTISEGNKVHLAITLDPGRRIRCGPIAVEGGGAGLSSADIQRLEQEWSRWEGEWLDLDQLDRARAEGARQLQQEGWYGFLRDHLVLDIDTGRCRQIGWAAMTLRILPRNLSGRLAPHRRGIIRKVTVDWKATELNVYRDTLADGVHWHLPIDRDLRPLTQRLAISEGDRFSPEAIAETRQLLRSASLVDRVDLEVSPLPETTEERDWPLELKASITPSPRRLLRLNGGLTSRQQIGGEAKLALSDLDFRRRMERLSMDLQVGLETIQLFANGLDEDNPGGEGGVSRILAASLQYDADRILPFAADRFPRSNRPRSRLSLTLRDENRPKFSRTFLQLALTEQFIENQAIGSRFELRPMEVTLTASRLESGFAQDLEELGLGILASTFASRALFATGVSWWYQPPTRPGRPRFSLHLEAEAAGHLFHTLDPRDPAETDIPIPSLFGSNSAVEVARYTRWVMDARGDWPATPRFGLHARCFLGVAASTIPGSAVPFEKQFYVGGANSMRGWRALGLGPGRSDATLQGVRGDMRFEANLEGRQFLNDWVQVAAFLDAGNIWMTRPEEERPDAHFRADRFLSDLGVSAGVGLRLDFEYFLLRCDVARPLRMPGGQSPTMDGWRIHPAVSLPF